MSIKDNPNFGKTMNEPVWYLAHPVAPDAHYTYEQNMAHVVQVMRRCYDEGFRVIAPWHTMCLAMDESDPEMRRIGLEVDCVVAKRLGRIILSGHRVSSGMRCELDTIYRLLNDMNTVLVYDEAAMEEERNKRIISLVNLNAEESIKKLREWKKEYGERS